MTSATEQDILACFRLILGREPHAEERLGHLGLAGQPLDAVVSGYLQSLEFRNRGLLAPAGDVLAVELAGYVVYVAKDDSLIGASIGYGYEPEVTRVFLEHLADGAVVDIGANCGYFSMLAASRGATVYAFEPLQRNLRLLHAGLAANGFEHIRIMAAAASDAPGTLAIGAAYTNGIVNEVRPNGPAAALTAEYVAAVRVDDVIPPEARISLIKIDVEGHEYRALLGARRTIERCRPVIISEFGPPGLEANSQRSGGEYLRLLRGFGYQISVIGGPEIQSDEAIRQRARGIDHIDILAVPHGNRPDQ
jgi:FkbM family methyltransferase